MPEKNNRNKRRSAKFNAESYDRGRKDIWTNEYLILCHAKNLYMSIDDFLIRGDKWNDYAGRTQSNIADSIEKIDKLTDIVQELRDALIGFQEGDTGTIDEWYPKHTGNGIPKNHRVECPKCWGHGILTATESKKIRKEQNKNKQ